MKLLVCGAGRITDELLKRIGANRGITRDAKTFFIGSGLHLVDKVAIAQHAFVTLRSNAGFQSCTAFYDKPESSLRSGASALLM